MKTLFSIFFALLALSLIGLFFTWHYKKPLLEYYLSKKLQVPVTIDKMTLSSRHLNLEGFRVGNPPRSQTASAFQAQNIEAISSFKQIRENPLTIDFIALKDLLVNIEYYDSSEELTNWNIIMKSSQSSSKKSKDYLIKRVILQNLNVVVTKANGAVTRYPTIPRMEFYNISSETGFPLEEIEKAIFNLMLQQVFERFNLKNLLDPREYIKRYLPFFGESSDPSAPCEDSTHKEYTASTLESSE